MEQIVGVRFKPAGKIYYFDGNDLELHLDDGVIVETSRGLEYGYVVTMPTEAEKDEENPMKPVIRRATIKDMAQLERNKAREKSAFDICLQKIEKFKVPMKLLRAEYTFDRNKIVFFFTSDGRVDFRELVKELAAVFHTRIELRQVGVRDEAKQVSGIGSCAVLRDVPRRFRSGVDQDGKESGTVAESDEDFGCLWASYVLPAL